MTAMISWTWARASSSPWLVSTTKSARRRFSSSGICWDWIAPSRSGVIPSRANTRFRSSLEGGDDDDGIHHGVASSLKQQRDIQHDHVRARRLGRLEEVDPKLVDNRMHNAAELL